MERNQRHTWRCFQGAAPKHAVPSVGGACWGSQKVGRNQGNSNVTQWRANQLVDALAKRAAPKTKLREAAEVRINIAGESLVFFAAMLGVVTRAANCHKIGYTRPDGKQGFIVKRDSSNLPRKSRTMRESQKQTRAEVPPPPPPASGTTEHWCEVHSPRREHECKLARIREQRENKKAEGAWRRKESALPVDSLR